MTEANSLTTPRNLKPFGGEFDQVFSRMMRNWPFNWPEFVPTTEPRALRAFEHMGLWKPTSPRGRFDPDHWTDRPAA